MRRRHFLTTLAALAVAPACALRGNVQKPELASIMGYVFTRRGVKLGRRDMRVPYVPVTLWKYNDKTHYIDAINKTRTDSEGRYEFNNLPGGLYYVQPLGGFMKPVNITRNQSYYAGLFQGWKP